MNAFYSLLTLCVIVAGIITTAVKLCKLLERQRDRARAPRLRQEWRKAIRRRRQWLVHHNFPKNPLLYPEYKELWERELSAEERYRAYAPRMKGRDLWPSWKEYTTELDLNNK